MTDRELLDRKGHEVNDDLPPLPEPFDYCYEWDGPFGTRKFSVSSYNGRGPDRSVPLYTADQLRAAVLAERERCAKVCEGEAEFAGINGKKDACALNCAATIRAGTKQINKER